MKKILFSVFLVLLSLSTSAQTLRFAYFRYTEVLQSMPEYTAALQETDELRAEYDAEIKRSEDDFNAKYEDFLDKQHSMTPAILRKRQAELQDLMEKNIAFKEEAKRLLQQAEQKAYAPARQRLEKVVREHGEEGGYAFVLNADNNALPYVDSTQGTDLTDILKEVLSTKQLTTDK